MSGSIRPLSPGPRRTDAARMADRTATPEPHRPGISCHAELLGRPPTHNARAARPSAVRSKELVDVLATRQFDHSSVLAVIVDRRVETRSAVPRVSPDPSQELRIDPFGAPRRLDGTPAIAQLATQRLGDAHRRSAGQDDHGVNAAESHVQGRAIVAVDDPTISGQQRLLDDSPFNLVTARPTQASSSARPDG